jgi:hypothetical protein
MELAPSLPPLEPVEMGKEVGALVGKPKAKQTTHGDRVAAEGFSIDCVDGLGGANPATGMQMQTQSEAETKKTKGTNDIEECAAPVQNRLRVNRQKTAVCRPSIAKDPRCDSRPTSSGGLSNVFE